MLHHLKFLGPTPSLTFVIHFWMGEKADLANALGQNLKSYSYSTLEFTKSPHQRPLFKSLNASSWEKHPRPQLLQLAQSQGWIAWRPMTLPAPAIQLGLNDPRKSRGHWVLWLFQNLHWQWGQWGCSQKNNVFGFCPPKPLFPCKVFSWGKICETYWFYG